MSYWFHPETDAEYPFKRFPYTVIYRASETDGPKVYTVAHQSREPGYWRERRK